MSLLGQNHSSLSQDQSGVPDEICTVVEELRNFILSEKEVSNDLTKLLSKRQNDASDDTEDLSEIVLRLGTDVKQSRGQISGVREEASRELLVNLKMAEITHMTPTSLQAENTGPSQFFVELVEIFREKIYQMSSLIKVAEQAISQGEATENPNNLKGAVSTVQESLVTLAAMYQPLHSAVQTLKHDSSVIKFNSYPVTKCPTSVPNIATTPPIIPVTTWVSHQSESPPARIRVVQIVEDKPLDLTIKSVDQSELSQIAGFLGSTEITWDVREQDNEDRQGGHKRGKIR